MSSASPHYQRMLAEYRVELAEARARLVLLPPEYAEVVQAYIARCEAAVDAIEQVAGQLSRDAEPRYDVPGGLLLPDPPANELGAG